MAFLDQIALLVGLQYHWLVAIRWLASVSGVFFVVCVPRLVRLPLHWLQGQQPRLTLWEWVSLQW
jgi:hypothetical protein